MNLTMNHQGPIRLSPITDDLESEYGAEVNDIPLYRSYDSPVLKETKRGRTTVDQPREQQRTHELVALVAGPDAVDLINLPIRSR